MKYSHRVTTRSHNSRLNQHRLQVPTSFGNWLPMIAQRHPKSHGNACLDKSNRMLDFVWRAWTCELLCSHCKLQNLTILKIFNAGSGVAAALTGCNFLPCISKQAGLGWAVVVRWQAGGLRAKWRRKTMALGEGNRKMGYGEEIVLQSFPCEFICKDHHTSWRVY